MEIKTVSLIGLGAIGILYAHQLSKALAKESLRIVADRDRIGRYENDGIYINGERCDFYYVPSDEKCTPADLILIAVKYNGLADAVKAIKNHVGPDTIILSLLNGISSEAHISKVYGADKVLPCIVYGMDAVKTGTEMTYQNRGFISFGDFTRGTVSEKVRTVGAFFEKTGIPYEISEDMRKKQWSKFMLNAGCNQATAVYMCNYAGIQKDGPYRALMISAMEEVAGLAEKEGITLARKDIDYWCNIIDGLTPGAKPSMQQDVEAGRYSEVEMFGGTILELAEKHGVNVPVNRMLYEKIKAIEMMY
ncbi:MAG: 2-dehydropantoate 2-reductase [Clostridiales bacterium]|nr:2-dehydropantoate 2-reductase [Clostridiales bacterium]